MDVKDTSIEAGDNRRAACPGACAAVDDAGLPDAAEGRCHPAGAGPPRRAGPRRGRAPVSGAGARLPDRDAGCAVREGPPVTVILTRKPGMTGPGHRRRQRRGTAGPVPGPACHGARWPATGHDRGQVLQLVAAASSALPESRVQANHRRGLPLLLDWLEGRPGRTWQQRWLASGADAAGEQWAAGPALWLRRRGSYSASRLELMTSSLLVVVGADVIRPSLAWLLTGGKKRKLARNMICSRDPAGFARLRLALPGRPRDHPGSAGQGRVPVGSDHRRQRRNAHRHHHRRRPGDPGRRGHPALPVKLGRGDVPDAAGDGHLRARRAHIVGNPRHRAAHGGGTGRPLPDRLPARPGPDRRLPEGTLARHRLRDLAPPRPSAGRLLLGGPGAAPAGHQLSAPALRDRHRLEAATGDQDQDNHHRHG